MDEAGCLACLPPNQLAAINTAILCRIAINYGAMATCDPQTLVESAACFACLSPFQLQIIQTQLLCEILNSAAGSGGGGVLCGVLNPVAAPTGTCALYYRIDNGSLWMWNGVTWVPLIAA